MGRKVTRIRVIDIQAVHDIKLLELRRQCRLVNTIAFDMVWLKAGEKERRRILWLLKKIKPDKLKELMLKSKWAGVDHLPLSQLRLLASYYHIKNYSRKTKVQLAEELKNARCEDGHRESIEQNEADSAGSEGAGEPNKL